MANGLLVSTLLCLLLIQSIFPRLHSGSCVGSERAALVAFKAGLADPGNILSSWEGVDCCGWWGVECSNITGRVLRLDLRGTDTDYYFSDGPGGLGGEISPALLHLKHLRRLDLSLNNFTRSHIPEFFGSFKHLRYLNLSGSGFVGPIPPQLGNLSRLGYLDIHTFSYNPLQRLQADTLGWLQRLSSLKHLDMAGVNLTGALDWLYMVNMLPSLTFLNLMLCRLDFIPSHLPTVNFTSLETLDLSDNHFDDTFPRWVSNLSSLTNLNLEESGFHGPVPDAIGNLTSLETLDLRYNNFNDTFPRWVSNLSSLTNLYLDRSGFHGPVPDAIGNLTSLEVLDLEWNDFDGRVPSLRKLCSLNTLDLSYNNFIGDIDELLPDCTERRLQTLDLSSNGFSGRLTRGLEHMANLQFLDLSYNKLNGPVPDEIGRMSQLIHLDLGNNYFKGVVTEAHFANLTRLKWLSLSNNQLNISVGERWVPPFQLNSIELGSCLVGPSFPAWLQHQNEVSNLVLSGSGISGTVPGWVWTKQVDCLDLSNNQLRGKLPESLPFQLSRRIYLDLSYNQLSGKLPESVRFYITVRLRSNMFEGSLPPAVLHTAQILDLSNNSFSGPLPSTESPLLWILDLSGNHFNSNIPSSLIRSSSLGYLDLSDNNFSGEIPDEWAESVQFINLRNNHLAGQFPASLRTCNDLRSLDIGHNELHGTIPTWIGGSFPLLSVLLRSNMFSGAIPTQLTRLQNLQILDLAGNNLSGQIPRRLGNLASMASTTTQVIAGPDFGISSPMVNGNLYISLLVFTKGEELEYTRNRYLVRSIDLSNNRLSGEIPEEIGALAGLIYVNLSANQLEGMIPDEIGRLQALESLDLSRNQLSGIIPLSLSSLYSLSHLNLSYNHLSGRIPSGYQLQTLNDSSIYEGNTDLCGPPLTKICPGNTTYDGGHDGDDGHDGDGMVWMYIGMGPGYVAGF